MISRALTASQICLASDIANEFFPNIKGDSYRDDASWLATMRALLPPRLGQDVSAQIRYFQKESKSHRTRAARVAYYLDGVDVESPNTISVINVQKTTEEMDKVVDAFMHLGVANHSFAQAIYDRYAAQEPKGYVLMYINDENANTVIVTTSMSMHTWHALSAFMRHYFRKAFAEQPVTEKEMELMKALASVSRDDNSTDTYLRLIDEFAEPYDFRGAKIRHALANFTTRAKEARRKAVERTIRDANDTIRNYHEELGRQLAIREKAQWELAGLITGNGEDTASKDLMDYFLSNRQLIFTESSGERFNYWVKTYLTYWEERAAESYIKTRNSYLYSGARDFDLDEGKFEKMLRAIFIERTIRIRMTAAYQFTFSGSTINIDINASDTQPPELKGYMLNPHPMYNNCWGTASRNLSEALSVGDYAGAVGVTTYAASELNITDVSTAQFSHWLAQSEWDCIELPDGTRMTCRQYLDTLKE